MGKRRVSIYALVALAILAPGAAAADSPAVYGSAIPDHCGRFTIAPGGGETLVEGANDYRIDVYVWDENHDPVSTLGPSDLWLDRDDILVACGSSDAASQADSGTDPTGHTQFSGTIFGGLPADAAGGVDCAATWLYVYAIGMVLNDGEPVCVAFDSPDLNGDRSVGIADFARFAVDFNCSVGCDPCHDYDEDGGTGIADFGIFAGYFNASTCP